MRRKLTAERLREVLSYDQTTGLFTWLVTRGKAIAGEVAGSFDWRGYINIGIDGADYKAHRLAWLYVASEWPADEIDHRNTTKADNRWANLRVVPHHINTQNERKPRSSNGTGFLGVSRCGARFKAQITLNGKQHNLGLFPSPEIAHKVYVTAKRKLHEGCTL